MKGIILNCVRNSKLSEETKKKILLYLNTLEESNEILERLEAYGVEDWSGYTMAIEDEEHKFESIPEDE